MSFQVDVAKFAAATGLRLRVVVQKTAVELLRGVVFKTPVDTGRARGNWLVGVGAAREGTVKATDKTGAKAILQGTANIAELDGESSVFITNNLPYIGRLEKGHSKQAPAGMVAVTVASFNEYVNKAIQEAKGGSGG